jgi:hypothetical protein
MNRIKKIIKEEIFFHLREWDDPNADWIYDLYEERDQILRDTIEDFMEKPFGSRQPWKLVPFQKLKKIWEDWVVAGYVRDTKGLEEIKDRLIRNLLKLDVNTELMGHMDHDPDETEFEDAGRGYTKEEFQEKMDDNRDIYFEDPVSGHWRISDYGLKPLWKQAERMMNEKNPDKLLPIIDEFLQVIHMRGDLASWFVEGGSSALSDLSGYERDGNINEVLVGKYINKWDKTKTAVEIYKNPKSLKNFNPNIRGIINSTGDLFIADVDYSVKVGSTTHADMVDFLFEKGETINKSFFSDGYENLIIYNLPIERSGLNSFYLSSFARSYVDFFSKNQLSELIEKCRNKNPNIIIFTYSK